MSIKHEIRKLLWHSGYDIIRFNASSHHVAKKQKLFESYEIDTVLDVGANTGQFAQGLRGDIGYSGRIISFEPLSSAFELLMLNAKDDPKWEVNHFALGSTAGRPLINIASNSVCSSILDMLPSHLNIYPSSRYIGTEEIEVKALDSIFDTLIRAPKNLYLKIDTQGFENEVLKGAKNSLVHIDTVEMEMSLVPLYAGELLYLDLCNLMSTKGYTLIAIEHVLSDPNTGQDLQINGIFHRF